MKKTFYTILIVIAAIIAWYLIGKYDEAESDRIYERGFEDGTEYGKYLGYEEGYTEGYEFGWNDGYYDGINHEKD